MKKIVRNIVIATLLIGAASCENYLDVNEDPNNPQVSQVTPEIVLPGAQTTTGETFSVTMNQLGNLMAVNWGGNVSQFATPFQNEFTHNISSTFYNGIWDTMYLRLANYSDIINSNKEGYENYKAISHIMRSFYFQYLVDLYGDIPYTEVHKRGGNLFPRYDKQTDVYRALITELNTAINLIDNSSNAKAVTSDVMLQGDMMKWKQFANTIKLRILLRQADKAAVDGPTNTYLTQQFAALDKNFIGASVTLNPGYANQQDKQNPLFATFGFSPGGVPQSNDLIVATKHVIEFLNGTTTGVADNRMQRIYRISTSGNYYGVEQGAVLADLPSGQTLSKLGAGLKLDSNNPAYAAADVYIMTLAESLFLQAEAAQRGFITGDAKALFQDGIRASFSLLGAANVNTYLTNSNNVNKIGWDGSSNKIEAIMTQKWIALNGINGIESWIEHTRTGFPVLPLPKNTDKKPVRLLYPQSEISGNTTNVPVQSASDAFSSKIFWDVN